MFVSLCLRYDFIKSIDFGKLQKLIAEEPMKGFKAMEYLYKQAESCKKSYFTACMIGYFIAIIATIIVMLVFEHGQPALLYLVPGCIISVLLVAVIGGEYAELWEFDEEAFTTPSEEDQKKMHEEEEKKKKGIKVDDKKDN